MYIKQKLLLFQHNTDIQETSLVNRRSDVTWHNMQIDNELDDITSTCAFKISLPPSLPPPTPHSLTTILANMKVKNYW